MNPSRERIRQELQRLAAVFLTRESNRSSLMTVTDCILSDDGKHLQILFTVLPESSEEAALAFAKRQRGEFRKYVKEHGKISRIPFFDFDIDRGEKNRQRIDELLRE